MLTTPLFACSPSVVIGKNYSYTFSGDSVQLEVDIAVSASAESAVSLQLWASATPFEGGLLQGVKVAEVACGILSSDTHISECAKAYVPAGRASHFMVLALVASPLNEQALIVDYVNFAQQQVFIVPRMNGKIVVDVQGDAADITIEQIENPRIATNLSGTLALELWSLSQPYTGASFNGVQQGGVLVGTLLGQTSWSNKVIHMQLTAPIGDNLVLMLREWTGSGYITRDYYAVGQTSAPVVSAPVEAIVVEEHTLLDLMEKVEEIVEAVTPFVESVAHTVGSVVSAMVEAAEQFIEDAEKSIIQELEDITPESVATEPKVEKSAKKTSSRVLKAKPAPKTVLSLNVITEEQLTELKGISKAVAKAIVEARPYARWDEVATVKGVGGKLLIKLKANFVL